MSKNKTILRTASVGGLGAIWGLGLARILAEAGFYMLLHHSPLAVAGVATACAVIALLLFSRTATSAHAYIPLALPALYITDVTSRPLAGSVLLVSGAVLTSLLLWKDRPWWVIPALLGLTTFGLYLHTLLPSLGEADTFEFQVIAPRLGVAHPTGYPLYILLGKLFTLFPLRNVAWRVNLASAVFATGATLMLYAILHRRSRRPLFSFLTALAFAFSSTFWSQAIVAEVYALHNLLAAIILWLLLSPSDTHLPVTHRWQAILFLLGLSFTNHLTTALSLPAAALALIWNRPRLRIRDWLVAGGLFLLGLSIYLFIPLRWPALHDGQWMSLHEFAAYVTGGQFHGALQLEGWRDPARWSIIVRLLREPFGWIGLILATAGAASLALQDRRTLTLTGATFASFILYGLAYHVPDVSVFLLPAHLILAIWIGLGVASLAEWASRLRFSSPDVVKLTSVIPLALLALSRIWLNLPAVDQSHNRGSYAWGQYVLSLPLEKNSAILADTKKFAPLYYLQQVEGTRPDLDMVLLGTEALYQAELRSRLENGQTVYLARYLPHVAEFHLDSEGPLVQVQSTTSERENSPPSAQPANHTGFGEAIQLLSADLSQDPLGRPLYHLTLHWKAKAPVEGDFVVRLRLVDEDSAVHWTSEGARPVNDLYPTNAWPVDVKIDDYHEVSIPPWLAPGDYALQVALFPPFGDEGLTIDHGARTWLTLQTLTLTPPSDPPPLPHQRRCGFTGGAWLIGYDLTGEIPADAPLTVDLAWRDVEQDESMRLAWADETGQARGETAFPLVAGMVRSRHTITAPQTPGGYTLRVKLTGQAAHGDWLAPPRDSCSLASVEVLPAHEGLANFADRLLLLSADMGKESVRPGELIPVTLRWRALRALDKDYTAFVHLIGPDGRLHGQVDAWPVQGSYPTSQWSPNEEVDDRYEVRLEPDAPPGHYRVEVGWYLLETMQRLQVLDAKGTPVGDSFTVGSFDVE